MNIDRLAHAFGTAAVGLIAGTALAHVFEMPHKLAMSGDTWLSVQSILYNWWGAKLLWLDVAAVAGLLFTSVRSTSTRGLALAAVALLLAADFAVFLTWVRPTNVALDFWTGARPMQNWQTLRSNGNGGMPQEQGF